jgi:hypothetical protein
MSREIIAASLSLSLAAHPVPSIVVVEIVEIRFDVAYIYR